MMPSGTVCLKYLPSGDNVIAFTASSGALGDELHHRILKGIVPKDSGVPRLLKDLSALLDDVNSADLVFFVGAKEIPMRCHSIILRSRCTAFRGETRFPDVTPDVFKILLGYIYTGKFNVDHNNLFDLFSVAGEFGVEDLVGTCEEILCGSLDPNNVFNLLNAALVAKQTGKKYMDGILDRCISFVGENASEVLQSSGFLTISQNCLAALVNADNLCLEEEEVWRCVLRWAQYQANVETHVSCWSESEKLKVAKYLTPVISHVRLLLIDSRVFAEEVEPTGCVPMALSLDRYRFAALPHQFHDTDPRLTPRNSPRLFQSSSIINNERIMLGRKLNEWYGSSKQQSWRCIYRASLHGYEADSFHNHCDGIAPTYVVALIQNTKWICGGFSDVAWSRSKTPRYATSTKAFLFCFDGNSSSSRAEPVKFNVVKKHFALCHDSNSGPIFGAGADLYISSNCNNNSDSYSNLPHSYESENGTDPPEVLSPSYHFKLADYEVFTPAANPGS
ncbi:unnamed protein product [Allacma fusca]|uniref:TLDc domain-containing protein n=1 Tax=Allacma fusca TaxID=39272 RepID=A0A8J2JTW9_9HEXA|nr:unnamed protein product [Allacma fusca]